MSCDCECHKCVKCDCNCEFSSTPYGKNINDRIRALESELDRIKDLFSERLNKSIEVFVKDNSKLENDVIKLELRLKELEDWIRADEDRLYSRLKDLEGASVKNWGYLCTKINDMNKRIEKLEEQDTNPLNVLNIKERLEELEKVWQQCSDANPIKSIDDEFNNIKERLEKLEGLYQQCFGANPPGFVNNNFKNMEARIKELESDFEKLAKQPTELHFGSHAPTYATGKVPYKCPSCAGEGKRQYSIGRYISSNLDEMNLHGNDITVNSDCQTCNGTGVLWG